MATLSFSTLRPVELLENSVVTHAKYNHSGADNLMANRITSAESLKLVS